MNLTSPLTGAAQSGLTSPTYTLVADVPPNGETNAKQWVITGLGGTQTGVDPNTIGKPFTLKVSRPNNVKTLSASTLSAVGYVGNAPRNENRLVCKKSVAINGVGGFAVAGITVSFDIPVGAIEHDLVSVKALHSAAIGALIQTLDQWVEAETLGTL